MWYLLSQSFPSAARALLEQVLAGEPPDRTVGRARALYILGQLRMSEFRFEEMHALSAEALDIAREVQDSTCIAWTMAALGSAAMFFRRYDEAEALCLEVLEQFGRDNPEAAPAVNTLTYAYLISGDLLRLRSLLDERLIPSGDRITEAVHLQCSAYLALHEGRLDEAERLADSLSLGAPVLFQVIAGHVTRAVAVMARGELAQGLSGLRHSLAMMCADSDWHNLDWAVVWLAAGHAKQHEMHHCATLLAGVEPFLRAWMDDLFRQTQDHLKAVMEPSELESCWARGTAMSLEQLIAYALEEPETAGG